ncbi:protein of unknown function [Methylacidimicrobium sp. AP8]|uniref:hypothetical protein n=1 Tax=Methylacidimicrobium sp. AP8 TaxID=2730359 RepID=UPI0018C03E71|nr:protein of unknown function [Methylacidimicrobium sp. AP8]
MTCPYSTLVAAIIGTAVIPTVIANRFFLSRHRLPKTAAVPPVAGEKAARLRPPLRQQSSRL